MKQLVIIVYIMFLSIGVVFPKSITVNSPNGGESWKLGSIQNIVWSSSNLSNDVKITLWNNNVFVGLIIKDQPENGMYSWTVGNYQGGTATDGSGYKIKIREQGGTDYITEDMSNGDFTLKQASNMNMMIKPVEVTIMVIKPDLEAKMDAITSFGNYAIFYGNVWNRGKVDVKNPKVKFEVNGPEGFIPLKFYKKIQTILKSNDRAKYSKKYFLKNLKRYGEYKIIFTVDPTNNIDESNENNNKIEFYNGFSPLPDLIVCTSNNKRPPVGKKIPVLAVVKNIGTSSSNPCKLRFYIQKHGGKEYDIPVLNPGMTHTITREIRWGLAGTKKITANIDYYKIVKEFREDNNSVESSYFVRLPHHKKGSDGPAVKCSNKKSASSWNEIL